jgi:hypothetical protein
MSKALKPWERKILKLYKEARERPPTQPQNAAATTSKIEEEDAHP